MLDLFKNSANLLKISVNIRKFAEAIFLRKVIF